MRKFSMLFCHTASAAGIVGLMLGSAVAQRAPVQKTTPAQASVDLERPDDSAGYAQSAVYGQRTMTGIERLDEPSCYRIPPPDEDLDPLEDVAAEIRQKIDPTLGDSWPDGYNTDFIEHIQEIYPGYARFWRRIPPESRRYVDLDNDGTEELVVISDGMNDSSWGFHNFVAVLKRVRDTTGHVTDRWALRYFEVFSAHELSVWSESGRVRLADHHFVVTDLDRDGRPDVLITTMQIGGSSSGHTLHALSLHPDLRIRHHQLVSAAPIAVRDLDALRPVFVTHDYDDWGPDDVGASVRARGLRRTYHRWTVLDGFVRF